MAITNTTAPIQFKVTAELKEIAKTMKDLTVLYAPTSKGKMTPNEIKSLKSARKSGKGKAGWTGPGNLKRKINAYNTYDNMIQFNEKGVATVTVDYAPPGAEYGEYWNDPFKIVAHRPEYDFATKAVNDPKVNALIDAYIANLQSQVATNVVAQLGGNQKL
jgi:hypothetical protein